LAFKPFGMVLKHIYNDSEFYQAVTEGENKLIICDFFAEWLSKIEFYLYFILGADLVERLLLFSSDFQMIFLKQFFLR
jgi:hypothetical protein